MIRFTYNTDFLLNNEPEVAELINTVAISKGKSIDKFFYHFVSETKIQQVNEENVMPAIEESAENLEKKEAKAEAPKQEAKAQAPKEEAKAEAPKQEAKAEEKK